MQENVHLVHLTKQKRAGSRGGIELSILLVGLTLVCLQLNCCYNSQSSYSYNIPFPSRPRFPVKHSVLCKYNKYYVTNCSTEIGEQHILFFLGFVEESSKRAPQTIACPCRKHAGGYTAVVCVCEHKHMSNACPSVGSPRSYRLIYFFNQSFCIEYASMTLFDFQFPESHKIILCWDADVRARNPKSTRFQISRILNFQPHKIFIFFANRNIPKHMPLLHKTS